MNSVEKFQAKEHFSKTVADYDTVADFVVLKNQEIHQEAFNIFTRLLSNPNHILDLGCGSGDLLFMALERYPNLRVTGIDFSARLLSAAKQRLQKFGDRVTLIEEDFREFNFNTNFDGVISSIAIHNVSHDQKQKLFGKLSNLLPNGGVFLNADFYEAETPDINAQLKRIYVEYVREHLNGEELEVWLQHIETDMPMKLSKHSQLLKQAGFSEFKIEWVFNNEAIYFARK